MEGAIDFNAFQTNANLALQVMARQRNAAMDSAANFEIELAKASKTIEELKAKISELEKQVSDINTEG